MQPGYEVLLGYGTSSRIAEIQALAEESFFRRAGSRYGTSPYSVDNRQDNDGRRKRATASGTGQGSGLQRTVLKHGISGPELSREINGLHFLEISGLPCLWATLGDELLDLPTHQARKIVGDFTARIVKEQKQAGLPQYWVRVDECTGGYHANIIFPAAPGMVRKIRKWEVFAPYLKGNRAVQKVFDFSRLGRFYLGKERAPFVKGGGRCGRRLKGSHRIEGGGDRVRLSPAMLADALAAGIIEPWQATNAKRAA